MKRKKEKTNRLSLYIVAALILEVVLVNNPFNLDFLKTSTLTSPFTTAGNYTYDSDKITFSEGVASVNTVDQTDDDNNATGGFAAGTHNNTEWSSTKIQTESFGTSLPFPDNSVSTGYVDMTDNVGLWHLNEASWSGAADEVIDSSGTGNHGQSAGTANTTATAQIGRAGTFDGDSDYVSVGTTDLITQTKGTISFWIKTSTDSAGTVISTGDTDANNYFAIQIGNGATGDCANELISIIRNGANRRICYTTATRTELIDGNWHHIAITGDSMYKVYLDGVRKTLNNNSDGAWFDVTGVDSARIGATYRGGSNYLYFNGEIDELAVWSDELSGKEISAIYNIQKGLLDGHEASGDYTSRIMDAGGMWHGLRLLGYLIVHYTKHFLIMEGQILVIPLEL